jgi:uncharacterized protein with NRDE domain
MCLIVFAHGLENTHRLVLAANRDEYLDRPTAAMDFWTDPPGMLAGRDLRAGGTWFALMKDGRFGAITNVRDPMAQRTGRASRGEIIPDYLSSGKPPQAFLQGLATRADRYNGFNLLLGEAGGLFFYSNHGQAPQSLSPGIYCISNGRLDSDWPKQQLARAGLHRLLKTHHPLQPDALLPLLLNHQQPPDHLLPATGVPLEWERRLAPIFIRMQDGYGTRSSLVLLMDRTGRMECKEWSHDPGGGQRLFHFSESKASPFTP